ncbi:peptide-methionine (R)-S-oxide reductase MsrB [Lichenihabitans psoromatis]|uniref:peptide-methionine (R)-S-oxide reductase MsrB n=1 Tax=Lichenihabitans psoromatis TaxID=2528642 RepID=UPI001FE0774A|nr:peptide-methionine (R)-S-oxide reductase MsrB [Lichenihabitans psoromatis]
MMDLTRRLMVLAGGGSLLALVTGWWKLPGGETAQAAEGKFAVRHTDAEWRKLLNGNQYAVLRHQGTETPFTSPLNHEKRAGVFACAGCDQAAFSSRTKFDSGTGWPSFWQPLEGAVGETQDRSMLMTRTEVHCGRCGGHLGHVFNDGPQPTGLRYCMNGVAMTFRPGDGTDGA